MSRKEPPVLGKKSLGAIGQPDRLIVAFDRQTLTQSNHVPTNFWIETVKKGERPLNVPTAMASAESNHVDHVVELMERDRSASSGDAEEQTTPLLIQAEVPKINIFTASYPRRKPRDEVTKSLESETSSITQFILWVWSGCRYSGLLCMTLSSTIYFLMEVLSSNFSGMFLTGLCFSLHDAFAACIMTEITRRKHSGIWLRIARGFDCNGSL